MAMCDINVVCISRTYSMVVLLVVTSVMVLVAQGEVFRGRHVCVQRQQVQQSVPIRQSYRRAVYNRDLQRVTYQTAYRIILRMRLTGQLVPGCCPGWEKNSPRDTDCTKPICQDECQNGGQCAGPNFCSCPEGYAGHQCQVELDECTGRHKCQQTCTNTPGSYLCSCQEGFKLAEDQRSCELCLSCSKEFRDMMYQMDGVEEMKNKAEMLQEIQKQMTSLQAMQTDMETVKVMKSEMDQLHAMQREMETVKDMKTKMEEFEDIKENAESIAEVKGELESLKDLKSQLDALQSIQLEGVDESKRQNEVIQDLQNNMGELETIKIDIATIQMVQGQNIQELRGQRDLLDSLREEMDSVKSSRSKTEALDFMKAQVDTIQQIQLENVEDLKGQNETMKALKEEMDGLKNLQTQVEEIKIINGGLGNLLETKADAFTVHSLQEEVESLKELKSQMAGFQMLQEQMMVLAGLKAKVDSMESMKSQMDEMSKRITNLEKEKSVLQTNLTQAVRQYEEVKQVLEQKAANTEAPVSYTTEDPYAMDPHMPLDRLASLSEQISILEEKMADCACQPLYYPG